MSVAYKREELWERKVNEDVIKSGEMITFFRPDERICNTNKNKKCFNVGEEVSVVVVDSPGYAERTVLVCDKDKGQIADSVSAEVLPEFSNVVKRAKIVKLEVLDLKDIRKEHFVGSPNINSKESLLYALGLTYDLPLTFFNKVTRIELEYLD